MLNQYAVERGTVVHISWSDFAQHSALEAHRSWLESVDRGDVPAEAADSCRELLGEAAGTATTHEVVVSLTVARDRLGRATTATTPTSASPAPLSPAWSHCCAVFGRPD